MAKHSKRIRYRMHQGGMESGFRIAHGLPRAAHEVSVSPSLGTEEEFRLRYIKHAQRACVADAVRVFHRSRIMT